MRFRFVGILALASGSVICAQTWEFGGAAGYSFYRNVPVTNGSVQGEAGMRNSLALTAVLGQRFHDRWTAELRYLYANGAPFLASGSQSIEGTASTHALHYDFLFHFLDPDSRWQPYGAFGAGGKWFMIRNSPVVPPALQPIGYIRNGNEVKFLWVAGGGVKYRVTDSFQVDAGFRDYITGLPRGNIVPAGGSVTSGWLHQFTMFFGVSLVR